MADLPASEEYDSFRKLNLKPIPELENLLEVLKLKIAFVFSDQPIFEVK